MYRFITIITFLFLLLSGISRGQGFQPYKSGVITYHGYAYPVVPGTEEWKALGHRQRVESLQLPMDTLHNISTPRLLETCLYYPFNIDIFAFDDQMASFGRIKEQFNGYAELYQRPDFVQCLIDFYYSRDVVQINLITDDYEKGRYSFDFLILEYLFDDVAQQVSTTQHAQIMTLLSKKMEQKKLFPYVYSGTTINPTNHKN